MTDTNKKTPKKGIRKWHGISANVPFYSETARDDMYYNIMIRGREPLNIKCIKHGEYLQDVRERGIKPRVTRPGRHK
ncbi:MAG: hypothetical protein LBT45_00355 [Rickettsiales bacterium]|jgi:hypothetical protein|nr:hypothetical protein [Rickettsiales bacterium]